MDPLNPPATTRPATTAAAEAAAKIDQCRELDGAVRLRTAQTCQDIRAMGRLLCEAKALVGHGKWLLFLKEKWPDLPTSTAARWMKVHRTAGTAELNEELRAVTHAEAGEGDDTDDDQAADMGDAYEGEDKAQPAPKPKLKREPVKAKPTLDLEPAVTAAKERVAELRDTLESAKDLAAAVLDSPAGKEFRRLLRLSRIPVADDGTVAPLLTLYRETAKLNDQGFEA